MRGVFQSNSACRTHLTRRGLLSAGGAGLLGLSLPKLLSAETISAPRPGAKAKSVIFLFLFGGPSQLETFDMKPDAPAEIRGPFQPIGCRTPGLIMSEHLPRLANISDQFCVVRTMTHTFNDHSGGAHYMQTGKRWHIPIGGGFNATPEDWPSMGAVTEYLSQHEPEGLSRTMPSYAVLPNWLGAIEQQGQYKRPGQYAGWLGMAYNGLVTSIKKKNDQDNPYWRACDDEELRFEPEGLAPGVALETLRERERLLGQLEVSRGTLKQSSLRTYDQFRTRALALVSSESARAALDVKREKEALRDHYGRHLFGQSCLMARRLVEAGVRFVTVHYECVDGYSWDSHRNSDDVKKSLLPTFDQGCAALIEDLRDRGMLDETLVVAVGEMGRTPKANAQWGRDHWSTLFPALLSGGGIRGGAVWGRSDRLAANVAENPVSPEDLAATIYDALGIDHDLMLPDALGRPIAIVEGGRPVKGIFG
jgi:hypothetical protein